MKKIFLVLFVCFQIPRIMFLGIAFFKNHFKTLGTSHKHLKFSHFQCPVNLEKDNVPKGSSWNFFTSVCHPFRVCFFLLLRQLLFMKPLRCVYMYVCVLIYLHTNKCSFATPLSLWIVLYLHFFVGYTSRQLVWDEEFS